MTPRFFAVVPEDTRALSTEIVRSRMGEDLAGKKRRSVLSGFILRWREENHWEMPARQAVMRSSTWVSEGGKDRNS